MSKLISSLNVTLEKNASKRVNGQTRSERSITAVREVLYSNFRLLNTIGYKLEDASNLSERHLKALCEEWYKRGLSPKTIQGYLSHFRIFCTWIGKNGLVKDINYYLPNVPAADLRVTSVAKKSKSWAEVGIDVNAMAEMAMAIDWRFGCMILAMVAFGLRRIEVLKMAPWKADLGDRLWVPQGKNGRSRDVYIDTDVQRVILDFIKSKVKRRSDTLGWTERWDCRPMRAEGALKYSEDRYNYLMAKIGITREQSQVTGHGLRAQFAENAALLRSFIPPTLGGTNGQMSRDELDVGRMHVSELLGHSRISVTGAYYGSFGREGKLDKPGRAAHNINSCFTGIKAHELQPVPQERVIMCSQLIMELAAIGVYCDLRVVQILWEEHSKRYSTNWLELNLNKVSPIAALETAALSIMRRKVDDGSMAD
jgi:integrase